MKYINKITLFKKYLKLEEIVLETPDGKQILRERLDKKSAVAGIVHNTVTDTFLFVKQYRPGPLGEMVEIVAGLLDKEGEDPKECMKREVEEEVGFKVDSIELLMPEFYSSPGHTNEKMTLFYCQVSERVNEGGGVATEDENIEVIEMTEREVMNYEFVDAKSLLAIKYVFPINVFM